MSSYEHKQCVWCYRVGPAYRQGDPNPPGPHDDGSPCVCRHITVPTRDLAWEMGGRYYDKEARRWVCLGGCNAGDPLNDEERSLIAEADRLVEGIAARLVRDHKEDDDLRVYHAKVFREFKLAVGLPPDKHLPYPVARAIFELCENAWIEATLERA
ncbi:MAG TPA: hypothetical protein VKY73_19640 [Polyangiaceae bacterium]|nr:hypothetical protein [Polyangiaceae bacterium]